MQAEEESCFNLNVRRKEARPGGGLSTLLRSRRPTDGHRKMPLPRLHGRRFLPLQYRADASSSKRETHARGVHECASKLISTTEIPIASAAGKLESDPAR